MAIHSFTYHHTYNGEDNWVTRFFVGNAATSFEDASDVALEVLELWRDTVATRQCLEWHITGVTVRNVQVAQSPEVPIAHPGMQGALAGNHPLPFQTQGYIHFRSNNPPPNHAGKYFPCFSESDSVVGRPSAAVITALTNFATGLLAIGNTLLDNRPWRRIATARLEGSPEVLTAANPLDAFRVLSHRWGTLRSRNE